MGEEQKKTTKATVTRKKVTTNKEKNINNSRYRNWYK